MGLSERIAANEIGYRCPEKAPLEKHVSRSRDDLIKIIINQTIAAVKALRAKNKGKVNISFYPPFCILTPALIISLDDTKVFFGFQLEGHDQNKASIPIASLHNFLSQQEYFQLIKLERILQDDVYFEIH